MATLIRANTQIRGGTITRALFDTNLDALLTEFSTKLADIYATMSTDAERIDAVNSLTSAYEAADGDLKATIQSLADQSAASGLTKTVDAQGKISYSYVPKADANYIDVATTIHSATIILDAELKIVADALALETTQRQTAITDLQNAIGNDVNAALTAIRTNVGLESDNTYTPIVGRYLSTDQSTLKAQVAKLDVELDRVETKLDNQRVIKFEDMIFEELATGVVDGTNKTFSVNNKIRSGSSQVFLNGQLIHLLDDYTIDSNQKTIILGASVDAPISPDKIKVSYIKDNA